MTLSLEEVRSLIAPQVSTETAFEVGKAYLVRTVTHYYTGRLVRITPGELVLEDAAWIADTGRFSDSLVSGELAEIEPYKNPVILSRGAIVDATEWQHTLPKSKK